MKCCDVEMYRPYDDSLWYYCLKCDNRVLKVDSLKRTTTDLLSTIIIENEMWWKDTHKIVHEIWKSCAMNDYEPDIPEEWL